MPLGSSAKWVRKNAKKTRAAQPPLWLEAARAGRVTRQRWPGARLHPWHLSQTRRYGTGANPELLFVDKPYDTTNITKPRNLTRLPEYRHGEFPGKEGRREGNPDGPRHLGRPSRLPPQSGPTHPPRQLYREPPSMLEPDPTLARAKPWVPRIRSIYATSTSPPTSTRRNFATEARNSKPGLCPFLPLDRLVAFGPHQGRRREQRGP